MKTKYNAFFSCGVALTAGLAMACGGEQSEQGPIEVRYSELAAHSEQAPLVVDIESLDYTVVVELKAYDDLRALGLRIDGQTILATGVIKEAWVDSLTPNDEGLYVVAVVGVANEGVYLEDRTIAGVTRTSRNLTTMCFAGFICTNPPSNCCHYML